MIFSVITLKKRNLGRSTNHESTSSARCPWAWRRNPQARTFLSSSCTQNGENGYDHFRYPCFRFSTFSGLVRTCAWSGWSYTPQYLGGLPTSVDFVFPFSVIHPLNLWDIQGEACRKPEYYNVVHSKEDMVHITILVRSRPPFPPCSGPVHDRLSRTSTWFGGLLQVYTPKATTQTWTEGIGRVERRGGTSSILRP